MPSTTSSSVSSVVPSSTVITPSLPTFFMASAMVRPISASPLAEIVPICAISTFEVTFLAFFPSSATTASTARSMPRFKSIGIHAGGHRLGAVPGDRVGEHDRGGRAVAGLIGGFGGDLPHHAGRPYSRTCRRARSPWRRDTPSLVILAPKDLSIATLRPLGPSVTLTALARMSMPRSILSRASNENLISLAVTTFLPERYSSTNVDASTLLHSAA